MVRAFVANGTNKKIAPVISGNAACWISTERAMSLSAGVDIPAAIRTWIAWSTLSTWSPISLRMLTASASCEQFAYWMDPSYLLCCGTIPKPWEWHRVIKPVGNIILVIQSNQCLYHVTSTSTLWLFNIAMENCPFIEGLPSKNGDFP